MAVTSVTLDDFVLRSSWQNSGGSFTTPSTDTQTKQFTLSTVPPGSTVTAASFSAVFGSPLTGAALLQANNINIGVGSQSVPLTPTATGNGQYTVVLKFRANGSASMSDGNHLGVVSVGAPTVTVTYTPSDEEEEKEEEEAALDFSTQRQIVVFSQSETDFSHNGLAVLSPFSAVVHEAAGGLYDLQMEHPMDPMGKWKLLLEECVIRCPVPPHATPRIVIPPAALWTVIKEDAPLYSVLPSYTQTQTPIDEIISNPSRWEWSASKVYSSEDYCVYGSSIYQYSGPSGQTTAPPTSAMGTYWNYRTSISGSGGGTSGGTGIYSPGVVAETLSSGEMVTFVANYNAAYIQARSLRGIVGYVRRDDVQESASESGGTVVHARAITSQLFRIRRVECNADIRTLSVYATHISYDYQANKLFDCQLIEAAPATAIAIMQGAAMIPDGRLIATPMTEPYVTADWSWQNPISALLDPDTGMVPILRAQLIRDNADFFILPNDDPAQGTALRYGHNLLGVHWTRSVDPGDFVTRVAPRGEKANGTNLFLPEIYVDSENINDHPLIYLEVLNTGLKIGQKIKHSDGTEQTLTEADVIDMMRTQAQNRFTTDKADAVGVRLIVDFLMLGNTEEYAQYKGLERFRMYDKIRVIHGPANLEAEAQISEYSWDAVPMRFQSMELGQIFSFGGRTVAGYNVADGAITFNKLSSGAVKKIKEMNS